MISVLCVNKKSNYYKIENLDLWDQGRDSYNFVGSNPVITHAPCAQWSRLKAFAKYDKLQKELAYFCLAKVIQNGGIFEHPCGSSFFKYAGIKPTISIDQSWFGYPARKRTWLYFSQCSALSHPLSFDIPTCRNVSRLGKTARSQMPLSFCEYLVNCVDLAF